MIIHAFWLPDSYVMAFWLENSDAGNSGPIQSGPKMHLCSAPFSVCVGSLSADLDLYEEQRIALFPTYQNRPVASNARVTRSAALHPWRITTAETIGDYVVEYFLGAQAFGQVDGDARWGPSLHFWQTVAAFAELLVDNKCYTPGITCLEGKQYPSWQAALEPDSEKCWKRIVDCTPPSVLGLFDGEREDGRPLTRDAAALSFLDAAVDYLIRQQILKRDPRHLRRKKVHPPPYRQWLEALKSGHMVRLHGHQRSLAQFAQKVNAWNDCLRPVSCFSSYCLGFELLPPIAADGTWEVNYFVFAPRQPAVALDAAVLFNSADNDIGQLPLDEIIENLLAGLGRALAIFPKIGESLESRCPSGCRLDRDEALEFMTATAPRLAKKGFRVKLPTWWEQPQSRIGLTLRVKPDASSSPDRDSVMSFNSVVQYKWEIAVGDRPIEVAEFKQLARSKQPLVYREGQWVRVDPEALRKSIEILKSDGLKGEDTLGNAVRSGFQLERTGGLPVLDLTIDTAADGPLKDRLCPQARYRELPAPAPFVGTLRPYQVVGFSWLVFAKKAAIGACLADDMGLGKTVQLIAMLAHEKAVGGKHGPTLIVCPMSVVGNWMRELQRFAPSVRSLVHHGVDRDNQRAFVDAVNAHDVVITTYNLIVRDQTSFLRCRWWNIVLDEAQNIKNRNTKQSTAIRALTGSHRYCLTGTPIENRLTELWSIMDFLNPGVLGNLGSFRNNFAIPIERDGNRSRAGILRKILQPFILRRLQSDKDIIKDLPDKQEMKVYCNLTAEQAALYQAVVDDMLDRLGHSGGMHRRGMVLRTLMQLKKITNHPVHFLHDGSEFSSSRSGKLQRLEEMLDVILKEGDKALIFTQFTSIGDLMKCKLEQRFGIDVLYLHGGTPKIRRDQIVQRFQTDGGPPVFLLSLKAGGLGLNLTAANHVFHFDRWWNPAVENQATDRAYRIGQEKNVQVHKFICVGTIEEKIDNMIEDKKRLATEVVAQSMVTELSIEQLREAFTLSRDAVSE